MSNQIDDGGPAFPRLYPRSDEDGRGGMSLRDWFAGQERVDDAEKFGWGLPEALAGKRPSGNWSTNPLAWFNWSNTWQSKIKYARADAMIAARKEKP